MYDRRTRLADAVEQDVRAHFGDRVLTAVIPRNVRVSEAPSYGQSVMTYDPGSRGATSYFEAALEIADPRCTCRRRVMPGKPKGGLGRGLVPSSRKALPSRCPAEDARGAHPAEVAAPAPTPAPPASPAPTAPATAPPAPTAAPEPVAAPALSAGRSSLRCQVRASLKSRSTAIAPNAANPGRRSTRKRWRS